MFDRYFIHSFIQQFLWQASCVPGTIIGTGAEWEEVAKRGPGRHSHARATCCEEKQAAVIEDNRRASLRWCGREVIFAPRPKG